MPDTRADRINAIAFYLPQFHRIPENDEWWGEGFTEWTNVRKAKPLFPGHQQPRRPTELGYYDLTDPESRALQAELASANGIEAFCYWHYWFGSGRRILERPFADVLSSGQPDFPFLLCWANQSWTGVWHGAPNRMLMEQTYPGEEDDRAHFALVKEAFDDPRYLRVDDKPIFLVYAPAALPDAAAFVKQWRSMAAEAGLPGLHLIGMGADLNHPSLEEFDQVMLNAPGDYLNEKRLSAPARAVRRLVASRAGGALPAALRARLGAPRVFEFADVVDQAFRTLPAGERAVPCVIPGWDNTPRSGRRGVVMQGSTDTLFAQYLEKAIALVRSRRGGRRFVFLKAWNEWAEGNYLEPDAIHGFKSLDAIRRAVEK